MGVSLEDYLTPTDQWQQVQIPLQAFTDKGLDATRLQALEVVFEWGTGQGVLWLDNILIGEDGAPQAERRVLSMTDSDSRPVALHLPGGGGWRAESDSPWLASEFAGAGPASLTVQTNSWWLEPGTYTGKLVITGPDLAQETITVHLNVTQALKCYDVAGEAGVGIADLQAMAARWRTSVANRDPDSNPATPNYEPQFDPTYDGVINVHDIMRLVAHWGETCS